SLRGRARRVPAALAVALPGADRRLARGVFRGGGVGFRWGGGAAATPGARGAPGRGGRLGGGPRGRGGAASRAPVRRRVLRRVEGGTPLDARDRRARAPRRGLLGRDLLARQRGPDARRPRRLRLDPRAHPGRGRLREQPGRRRGPASGGGPPEGLRPSLLLVLRRGG